MNYLPIILLAIGGAILTLGDFFIKKWVITSSITPLIIGLFIWFTASLFLAVTYKYKNMALASVTYTIINIVLISILSWFYFKDKITPIEALGLLLGITSIILLEVGEG